MNDETSPLNPSDREASTAGGEQLFNVAPTSAAWDPTGPPQPVSGLGWPSLPTTLAAIAATGTAMVALFSSTARPCAGATRSSRLIWEERALQMDSDLQKLREESPASQQFAAPPVEDAAEQHGRNQP